MSNPAAVSSDRHPQESKVSLLHIVVYVECRVIQRTPAHPKSQNRIFNFESLTASPIVKRRGISGGWHYTRIRNACNGQPAGECRLGCDCPQLSPQVIRRL